MHDMFIVVLLPLFAQFALASLSIKLDTCGTLRRSLKVCVAGRPADRTHKTHQLVLDAGVFPRAFSVSPCKIDRVSSWVMQKVTLNPTLFNIMGTNAQFHSAAWAGRGSLPPRSPKTMSNEFSGISPQPAGPRTLFCTGPSGLPCQR